MSSSRSIVIGGGISGLSAAYYLGKRGMDATLIEARPYLGGVLHTEQIEGCTVETGADSWLASKLAAAELVRELGLGSELIGSNDAIRRTLIWKRGELLPFPEGMQLVAPTRFGPIWRSRLLSPSTKARMTLDWFRRPGTPQPERSVASFVAGHFGQEAVDYFAEPLLSGIYGGSTQDLSASSVIPKLVEHERAHGSLVRGLRPAVLTGSLFQTVRGGLGSFTAALRPASLIHGRAEEISRSGNGFRVRVKGAWIEAENVMLACESHQASRLVQTLDPELAAQLSAIRHSSSHIAAMAFRRAELNYDLKGFGFLVPKVEGRNMMACTWMSSKFPVRAPADIALFRLFFRQKPDDPSTDLREIMGITAKPLFVHSYEWPDSLPQYSVGHAKRIEAIEARAATIPGLYLVGNAYRGVGIPDCIQLARETVHLGTAGDLRRRFL